MEKCEKCPLKNLIGHENDLCINQKLGVRAYCKYVGEDHPGYINIVIDGSLGKKPIEISPAKSVPAPSLLERGVNFATAMKNYVFSGFKNVEDDEQKRRIGICEVCPHFTKNRTCSLCTCGMDWKTRLSTSSCPDKPPRW